MAILNLKPVDSIEGDFLVSSYQRGYRWAENEVKQLLDDVYNLLDHDSLNAMRYSKNYCLQPIVVKKLSDKNYEVIDGQQRLTTLFLLHW